MNVHELRARAGLTTRRTEPSPLAREAARDRAGARGRARRRRGSTRPNKSGHGPSSPPGRASARSRGASNERLAGADARRMTASTAACGLLEKWRDEAPSYTPGLLAIARRSCRGGAGVWRTRGSSPDLERRAAVRAWCSRFGTRDAANCDAGVVAAGRSTTGSVARRRGRERVVGGRGVRSICG